MLLLLLWPVLILPAKAAAQEEETALVDTQALEAAMPDEAASALEDVDLQDGSGLADALESVLEGAFSGLGNVLKSGLRSAGLMIVIAMFCALLSALYGGEASSTPRYVHLVGTMGIAAVALSDISGFIGLGQSTMTELSEFSRALLPTLSSTAALSGAVTSAAAKYAASALFMEILITLSLRVLLPMIYAYVAALIGTAATGSEALAGVAKLIRWAAVTALTLTMTVFIGFLGLAGFISSATDEYGSRFVKSAVSAALPVVGSMLADAAGTVVAGAGLIKNTIGLVGMLAVLAVCIVPVLRLGLQYLLYKCAAGISGILADKGLTELMNGIGSAFGMILGMTGSCAVMLFISVLSCMRVVNG